MNSLQRSWGKNFPFAQIGLKVGLAAGLVSVLMACSVTQKHDSEGAASEGQGGAGLETSLTQDQKEIEELRKNIPPEKRAENDQLKEILNLMADEKTSPSVVRDRFNRATQRMRDKFQKEISNSRQKFNGDERKAREAFYVQLKKERNDFNEDKHSRDESKNFYDDQEQRRKDFTADQKDKHNQYFADIKMKTDNFNQDMRERTNYFNEELRAYTQRYQEREKQKRASSGAPAGPSIFQNITPIKTGADSQ